MLQTVRDACHFDPKAIDYALSDQIESLGDLADHDVAAAAAFFGKTYVTGGYPPATGTPEPDPIRGATGR
jgi:hypothetical protein